MRKGRDESALVKCRMKRKSNAIDKKQANPKCLEASGRETPNSGSFGRGKIIIIVITIIITIIHKGKRITGR